MKKALVVAEKYAAACDIAKVLECEEIKDGYIEGEDYLITWADGHLIGFQYPEEYNPDYKEWRLEDLPLAFDPDKNLKVLPGKEKQFEIVKKLIQGDETDRIINAGDAGREGYLLQYWIYKMAGNTKPIKVLWASSLTEDALAEAFASLHDDAEFGGVLEEAKTRVEWDYFMGMNYSRLLTLKCSRDATLPYGSSMATLLNLVVENEKAISEFQGNKLYGIQAIFEKDIKATLLDAEETELILESKSEAQQLKSEIGKNGKVHKGVIKENVIPAPLLYSLPELQSAIGSKYKISPGDTLKIAQSLYEKKLITYPRTDSCYLTSDLRCTIERNLQCCRFGKFRAALERCETSKAIDDIYFNDEKVTDHHALIPTVNKRMRIEYDKLSEPERWVFDEIVFRFLGIFSKPRLTKSISVILFVSDGGAGYDNGYLFRATESVEVEAGYRLLRDTSEKNSEFGTFWKKILEIAETGQELNVPVTIEDLIIKEKDKKPPTRYTYGTITKLMEEYHIGTPATMAATIDKLLDEKRPFLTVKNGKYYSTPFGRMYISIVPEMLKSAELKEQMEWKLQQVRKGELTREQVLADSMEEFRNIMENGEFQTRSFERCLNVKKPSKANYKRKRVRYFE